MEYMRDEIMNTRSLIAALIVGFGLLLSGVAVSAQTATAPTPTGPSNSVQGTLFACANNAVLNLSGTLLTGWDVFFQLVSGGTPVTSVRQVSADGAFTFGESVPYPSGTTLTPGSALGARVFIARESNPSTIDFEFALNDIQDGCGSAATPQTNTGANASGEAGQVTPGARGVNLFAPDGQILNPNLAPEQPVVIGARPSDNFRSATPGLIFAECAEAPLALPGIIYDTDAITVYWSWWTRTLAQMEDHLATAQYSVRLNTAPFVNVQRSEITRRGGRYYVFYSAPVGYLRPGHYEVEYRVTWTDEHFDGVDRYGPGTENEVDTGLCNFDVLPNPQGIAVDHTEMYTPTSGPVHNIIND
jgi:hypothetical protein